MLSLLRGGIAPLIAVTSLFIAAVVAAACTGSDSDSDGMQPCTPDAKSVQAAIFVPSCSKSGCHGSAEPAAGLDLVSEGVESRLVEVAAATCDKTLVVPGSSATSFLYEKVSSAAPTCGARMPQEGSLTPGQIECVAGWIDALPKGCETCGEGGCVDLMTDPLHCGGCTTACGPEMICSGGACACSSGTPCGGGCVDTMSDPDNCGDCGKSCVGMQVCSLGGCSSSCGAGLTNCGGACVDLTSDAAHCGTCEKDCGPAAACVASSCACAGGGDTMTDPANCGMCGHACAIGQSCVGGACMCGTASVSFATAVQPIFTASCATNGCHKGAMPQEGMNLTVGKAYDALVGVAAKQCSDGRKRVQPGQPEASYLIDKLAGTDLCSGTKMPKSGGVMSAEMTTIANWICEGAPNN